MKNFRQHITEQMNTRSFAERVCQIYMAAPVVNEDIVPSYMQLLSHIRFAFAKLEEKIEIQFVKEDPYSSMEEMRNDVRQNKTLKVYTGFNSHPMIDRGQWDPEDNLKFRAVHDYIGHSIKKAAFDYEGEIKTYHNHKKFLKGSPLIFPALFCEILGQASCTEVNGEFPIQKIVDFRGLIDFDTLEFSNNVVSDERF